MNAQDLKLRLQNAYVGSEVEVVDLTGTQDHYEVSVTAADFKGLSLIQQHQSVMKVFAEELKTGEIHALSLKTKIKN